MQGEREEVKRLSDKTRRRYADAHEAREAIRARIPRCEYCGAPNFVLHEIPRCGNRSRLVGLASCVLGLCDPGCHQTFGAGPKDRQAALLLLRRPGDFNLAELNHWLIAKLDMADVLRLRDELAEELLRS